MHDLKYIRENPDDFGRAMQSRGVEVDLEELLALDEKRRLGLTEVEGLKNQRNVASKEIGLRKRNGEDASEAQESMRAVGEKIAALDQELKAIESDLDALLLTMPNTPHPSVPVGPSEESNVHVRSWGEKKAFDFKPLPHWELGSSLGVFDFDRAAKMSGSGFPLLVGQGARLQRALIQFMLDLHTTRHGYTEVLPPFLCNTETMTGTGQLPKMAEDMYHVPGDDLWLIPTAEVPVTNIYRNEIIRDALPIKLTAYTPCFRREAGAAGRDTRGLIRVHQFDKVEMVKFVTPESSYEELELLLKDAEEVLQKLGLHYRVLELCTGDISFAAAKCYDIELWAPGYDGWLEVSSCSNFEAFQARRAKIRFKNSEGKTRYPHTLNGSGVALPRLVASLLEVYQQEDGTILIPEILRPYMGGVERIGPALS